MLGFLAFATSLVVTMALIPPLIFLAHRYAVVDQPEPRKVHVVPVPRVGGIAMVTGAVVSLLLWGGVNSQLEGLLLATAVLFVFGAWDDIHGLGYRAKFMGQIMASSAMVLVGGVKLSVLPFFGPEPVPAFVAAPLTVLVLVAVTNAINLSDGLDGLAAGISLLSLSTIALLASMNGGSDLLMWCAVIAGIVIGFLRFNTYPAKVFMGDTGSQFLGFVLGASAIYLTQDVNTAINPATPLFLMGVPVVDTMYVMISRLRQGKSPFSPDRNHIHHRLLESGYAHYEAVAIVYLLHLAYLGLAVLLRYDGDMMVVMSYVSVSGSMIVLLDILGRVRRKRQAVTAVVAALDENEIVRRFPYPILQCVIPLYLLTLVLGARSVSSDIGVGALLIFLALLIRLVFGDRLRALPLRLLVFPAIAFSAYIGRGGEGMLGYPAGAAMLAVMAIAMYLIVRHAQDRSFRTTPTDVLVVSVTIGLGLLYVQGMLNMEITPMIVQVIFLFYASEMAMRGMKKGRNCLTYGILLTLGITSMQGIAPIF